MKKGGEEKWRLAKRVKYIRLINICSAVEMKMAINRGVA